jgi:uncharacterized protein (DUF1501 family)
MASLPFLEPWRDIGRAILAKLDRQIQIGGERGGAEFGRAARINGTDHGTGTIALLAGGAVMKGVLQDQFGLGERVLAETVFPDSAPVKPMKGLVG